MTERQVEEAVRATFRKHEDLIDEHDLMPQVRRRLTRRRRTQAVLAGCLVGALLVVAGGWKALVVRGTHKPVTAVATNGPTDTPDDWKVYSSSGAQFAAPPTWAINDYGCGMDNRPSVVRAKGAERACGSLELPTKELAILFWMPDLPEGVKVAPRSVTVDGVPGQRAETTLPDGRFAGWVHLPSRNAALSVRTRTAQTGRLILDSLHLVAIDLYGCATDWSGAARPSPPRGGGDAFVPQAATVSICHYGDEAGTRLFVSGELTGDAAAQLVAALNRASPGTNPDVRGGCNELGGPGPNIVLTLRDAAGKTVATVYARYGECTARGLDNGRRRVMVTRSLIAAMTRPLHSGVGGYVADLPK